MASGVVTGRKDLTANTTTIGAVSGCIQRITDPAARPLSYDASNHFTAVAEHSGGALAEAEPELPMSRRSPFLIELSDDERAQLDVGAQTHPRGTLGGAGPHRRCCRSRGSCAEHRPRVGQAVV